MAWSGVNANNGVYAKKNRPDSSAFFSKEIQPDIWAIYNDLSRGHPKWWFSKGILPQMALNQVKDL